MRTKHTGAIALAALLTAGLAGCATATPGASPNHTDTKRISVVTSTNVYGDVARQIGGDRVDVTAIIDSLAKDPHEYEATAKDRRLVSQAQLLVSNGGGYDAFIDGLVGDAHPARIVAVAHAADYPGDEDHAHDHDHADEQAHEHEHADEQAHEHEHADEHDEHGHIHGFNEHVWYDPALVREVAHDLAGKLSDIQPESASFFADNAKRFDEQIATLQASLGEMKRAHAGTGILVTEPVPLRLTDAAGLKNSTPEEFSEAVEHGRDVPPATLQKTLDTLRGGSVKLVITNAQTGGPETTAVVNAAKKQGIPIVEVTETLPEGSHYVDWMKRNLSAIGGALS